MNSHQQAEILIQNALRLCSDTEAEKVFLLLDGVFKSWETLRKNSVFYELLSIGQDLINSDDIKMFVEKTKLIDFNEKECKL